MGWYHSPMSNLTRHEEARKILQAYGREDPRPIMELIERQFMVLHHRSQVLLGLSGIVITTTGFSGRLIAGTNALAQTLIISGVALVMAAAATVCLGVLHLRWITQHPGDQIEDWLNQSLAYRDRKTQYYRTGIVLTLIGLGLYVGSIFVMLLLPNDFPGIISIR
jgi:hypothetical protein